MSTRKLEQKIKQLQGKLDSSSTAYTAGATPTSKDIKVESELTEAKQLKSRALGDETKARLDKRRNLGDDSEKKPGAFQRALGWLNAPVAAGAAIAETALGQGNQAGLIENIKENIEQHGTYGDVLRQSGASNLVAAPLGFALDVALDPLNIATFGTASAVGKVARGTQKAGLVGAKVSAKSAMYEKLDNLFAATSKQYNNHIFNNKPIQGNLSRLMTNVAKNSGVSASQYAEIVEDGVPALVRLTEQQTTNADKIIAGLAKGVDAGSPGLSDKAKRIIWGDAEEYLQKSLDEEDFAKGPKGSPSYIARHQAESAANKMNYEAKFAEETGTAVRIEESAKRNVAMAERYSEDQLDKQIFQSKLDDVIEKYLDEGSDEVEKLRHKDNIEEAKDYLATFTSLKADVEMYDKFVAKKLLNGTAQKFFKNHAKLMGVFKASVIGMSVPARVNQAIGNFIAFVPISGINPFNAGFTKSLTNATKFSYTQDVKYLQEMMGDDWQKLMKEYPDTFTKIMGIKAQFITEGPEYLRKRAAEFIRQGGDPKLAEALTEHANNYEALVKKTGDGVVDAASSAAEKRARRQATSPNAAIGTQFDKDLGNINVTQEFNIGAFSKWTKELEKKAAKGDKSAKMAHWMLTKPLEDYGRGDQIFKLGSVMHLTRNGISEAEMKVLQKWYKFQPGDISASKNGTRFRLTPGASMKVANEMFLNYSAMPAWSRIARVLPVVGMPFASFKAGAAKNVMKGIGYNPAYFNKVQNAIHEVSGEKGPGERKALESPYYEHITSNPAMVKIPFYKQNPVYLNLGNALHVFDTNLLDPPGRTLESKYGTELFSLIDKSGMFSDPTGQFMLNYAVMPMLLGEAIGPFNNELYPEDATALEKAGRALSGGIAPFVPRTPGALIGGSLPMSEEAIPYIPSYGGRRLQNAKVGKSASGTNSSSPPSELTGTALKAESGFPTYKVNTKVSSKK